MKLEFKSIDTQDPYVKGVATRILQEIEALGIPVDISVAALVSLIEFYKHKYGIGVELTKSGAANDSISGK